MRETKCEHSDPRTAQSEASKITIGPWHRNTQAETGAETKRDTETETEATRTSENEQDRNTKTVRNTHPPRTGTSRTALLKPSNLQTAHCAPQTLRP